MSSRAGTKQSSAQKQASKKQQQRPVAAQAVQATPQATAAVKANNAAAAADAQAALAAKRDARQQRQAAARAEAARQRRMALLRRIGIYAAIAVVIVGGIVYLMMQEAGKPGEAQAIMANRDHIADINSPHVPYSTDPPTSGPHVSTVPQWTVYTSQLAVALQVHGLEDGGVVYNYQPDLPKDQVDKLAAIAQSYEKVSGGKGQVLMSPYQGLSSPVVLTSWGRMDKLNTVDEKEIRRYTDAYVGIDHHEGHEGERIP